MDRQVQLPCSWGHVPDLDSRWPGFPLCYDGFSCLDDPVRGPLKGLQVLVPDDSHGKNGPHWDGVLAPTQYEEKVSLNPVPPRLFT